MPARIRSTILAVDVDEASRNDAVVGSVVSLVSLDAASTYAWAITFAPEGSTATFTGSSSAISPGTFSVDLEGPYLIRLIIDATLPTEDVQYVRVRALTAFGELTLVSAGERRDDTGVIPVDVDVEGWANEQNANIQTLLGFIKPMVASGRMLYVDSNDGTSEYADHATIQAAITDANSSTPSAAEPWVILVRPGTYTEDLTFFPWVHVLGWPGNPDGQTSEAVRVMGTHTAFSTAAPERTLLANLHIENATDTTSAAITKTGLGTLRVFGSKVESSGSDASQGPAILLSAGGLDVVRGVLTQNSANGAGTYALVQDGSNTTSTFNDSTLQGPSGVLLNDGGPVFNVVCEMFHTNLTTAHAAGTGIAGLPTQLTLQGCELNVAGAYGIAINPGSDVYAGAVAADVRFTNINADIFFEVTGLGGTRELSLGSVIYGATVFPGGSPTYAATTKSKTNFYDNTFSGLLSSNVQDAIDELSGSAAIAPLVYHENMPEVPDDTVRYRGWASVTCQLIAIRVYMESPNTQGNYTLTVTNNATGNTVLSAASFDMNTLVAQTPTPVALTAVPADLLFASLDRWTITLTSDDPGFDGESVYVALVFNSTSGAPAVVQDWATTLLIGNISGGTNPELTPGDVMVFGTSPVAVVSGAGQGRLRYNQGTVEFEVSVDGGPWSGIGSGGGGSPFIHKNVPPLPGNTYRYEGWTPIDAVVGDISVAMATVNTQGTYQATFTNETTGQTMLVGPDFAMNTLVAGVVTSLSLTGTVADLTFSAGDEWSVEFISDDLSFDGVGVYFSILFGADSTITVSGSPPDDDQFEVTVFPNNTANHLFFPPYDCTVTAIKVYGQTTPTTAGTYLMSVKNLDSAANLLSLAAFDLTGLPPASLTDAGLTLFPANLQVPEGTPVRFQFISDNADLVASGLYAQIIYIGGSSDDDQFEMSVFPNNTVNHIMFAPYDMQILAIKVYGQVSPTTAGVYTLAVEDLDGSNNLLSAATFDMTSLSAATLTTMSLTGTGANLQVPEGTALRFQLVSDNADLVASGLYAQIIFRSQ